MAKRITDEMGQMIHEAISKWENDHGELQNGDVFVTEFENGSMIIEAVDNIYNVSLLDKKPYHLSGRMTELEDEDECYKKV